MDWSIFVLGGLNLESYKISESFSKFILRFQVSPSTNRWKWTSEHFSSETCQHNIPPLTWGKGVFSTQQRMNSADFVTPGPVEIVKNLWGSCPQWMIVKDDRSAKNQHRTEKWRFGRWFLLFKITFHVPAVSFRWSRSPFCLNKPRCYPQQPRNLTGTRGSEAAPALPRNLYWQRPHS